MQIVHIICWACWCIYWRIWEQLTLCDVIWDLTQSLDCKQFAFYYMKGIDWVKWVLDSEVRLSHLNQNNFGSVLNNIYIYIYIYIYTHSWKQCDLPVMTTVGLWQIMHLGTWCTWCTNRALCPSAWVVKKQM